MVTVIELPVGMLPTEIPPCSPSEPGELTISSESAVTSDVPERVPWREIGLSCVVPHLNVMFLRDMHVAVIETLLNVDAVPCITSCTIAKFENVAPTRFMELLSSVVAPEVDTSMSRMTDVSLPVPVAENPVIEMSSCELFRFEELSWLKTERVWFAA